VAVESGGVTGENVLQFAVRQIAALGRGDHHQVVLARVDPLRHVPEVSYVVSCQSYVQGQSLIKNNFGLSILLLNMASVDVLCNSPEL